MVYAINHYDVDDPNIAQAHRVTRLILFVFVVVCVFDPADQILGGKVFVFIALWGVTLLRILWMRNDVSLPPGLVIYVTLFIAIPLLSIFWYYVSVGQQPFEGFALLKGYLLLTLALVLCLNRVDLLPQLSAVLTVLAVFVIAIFIAFLLQPDLYDDIKSVGDSTGLLVLDKRTYGEGLTLLQVYFVTAPMLAISIAYYFDRAMSEPAIGRKLFFLLVTAINIAGMFLAGTRNNIFVATLLPFLLWPLYTRRVGLNMFLALGILAILAITFADELQILLDPSEVGNSVKITTLHDYYEILSDPVTFLVGQGLGAYQNWTARPAFYTTELTYLEMWRNFGLVGALVILGLLLFPVVDAFSAETGRRPRALAVAYFLYLVMCFSNPNLFSSMGILILAILVANIFQGRDREARSTVRGLS